jgi:hypothetical protein
MMAEFFIYRDNTGGVNLRSNEANINSGQERTEATFINNIEVYKEGGFSAQNGNTQLNTGVTDETEILGIGQYKNGSDVFAVYVKASGKAYYMNVTGGAETEIKSGLNTTAIPQFVEFNGKVLCFNGQDAPWAFDGSTIPAVNLTGTPAAWSSEKPYTAAVYRGGRVFAASASTLYWCALGNENDWTAAGDAGQITALFSDNSDIVALADYDTAIAIFTASPKIYLLQGTSPANYTTDPVASNRAAKGKLGLAKSNDQLFFFAGDSILPLITTELGVIKIAKDTDLTYKISPFINGEGGELPLLELSPTLASSAILLSNVKKNELIAYFKSVSDNGYDTAAIFNFNSLSWVFRQGTPATAAAMVGDKALTGTADGKVLEEFTGTSIAQVTATGVTNSTFTKQLYTAWFGFNQPYFQKRVTRFFVTVKSAGPVTLTLKLNKDYNSDVVWEREIEIGSNSDSAYGEATYGSGTYGTTSVQFSDFPIDLWFKTLRAQFETTDDALSFRVLEYAFEVEYGNPY